MLRDEELARALVIYRRDCYDYRNVQQQTESNPAYMLTKTLGRSKVEEFCAEIGQTEPRAETVDKESKEAKEQKEFKFAVETMEMNETVKNKLKNARVSKIKNKLRMPESQRSRTSRRMQNYDGCILWIDFSKLPKLSKVWKMDNCGTRRDH